MTAPKDPRKRLARLVAKHNKGTTFGAFNDRRGNEWAATCCFLVRGEMVQPRGAFGEGEAPVACRKLLRKLSAEPSWPMRRVGGTYRDQSLSEGPVLTASKITDGPARGGHVWLAEEMHSAITSAAAMAWPTSDFSWHATGIASPAVLRRNRDRMVVAVLATACVTKPWKIEVVA